MKMSPFSAPFFWGGCSMGGNPMV